MCFLSVDNIFPVVKTHFLLVETIIFTSKKCFPVDQTYFLHVKTQDFACSEGKSVTS